MNQELRQDVIRIRLFQPHPGQVVAIKLGVRVIQKCSGKKVAWPHLKCFVGCPLRRGGQTKHFIDGGFIERGQLLDPLFEDRSWYSRTRRRRAGYRTLELFLKRLTSGLK